MASRSSAEARVYDYVSRQAEIHEAHFCLSSIVNAWRESSKISRQALSQARHLSRAMTHDEAPGLKEQLKSVSGGFDHELVQIALFCLARADKRHGSRARFAPTYVIDHTIRQCIRNRLTPSTPRFIDPFSGVGSFIVRAIELISEYHHVSKEMVLGNFVRGVEISPEFLEYTKVNLEMYCAENDLAFPRNYKFLAEGDALLTPKSRLLAFGPTYVNGYDIVASILPNFELTDMSKAYNDELRRLYSGLEEPTFKAMPFCYMAGEEILAPSGISGYITDRSFLTSSLYRELRTRLQSDGRVNLVVDLENSRLIPWSRDAFCLLFSDRQEKDSFEFISCSNPKKALLRSRAGRSKEVKFRDLDNDEWTWIPKRHLENLKKFAVNGTPLSEIAEIHQRDSKQRETSPSDCQSIVVENFEIQPSAKGTLFQRPIESEVLRKILNSRIMEYYLRLGNMEDGQKKDNYSKGLLENFYIPSIDAETSQQVTRLENDELEQFLCELFDVTEDDLVSIVG